MDLAGGESYWIDAACADPALIRAVSEIPADAPVELLVQRNSNTILEMAVGGISSFNLRVRWWI